LTRGLRRERIGHSPSYSLEEDSMRFQGQSVAMLSRRRFIQTAAVGAAAVTGSMARPARGSATVDGGDQAHAVDPPKPIPGGVTLPDGSQIHVWPAGDAAVTLPFTGSTLAGFDADPSTITDFRGFSAIAFHVGTATGGDGAKYDLETHMTALKGHYVGSDGTRRFGAFAFI
jgi:hypothetical protein